MAAQTYSANAIALIVTKRGVRCDGKRVRSWARANIARFNKATHADYQTHAYTAAERDRIVDALVKRARGSVPQGTPSRASSAARGRGASKAPKATPKAPQRARGTGSVPKAPKAPQDAPTGTQDGQA